MLNYIKSEFYRVSHTKGVYVTAGILSVLTVVFHVLLKYFGGRYAITSFSYSNIVAQPVIFSFAGAAVAWLLYEGNRRNGNLKNTVSGGISRGSIFVGESIVSVTVASITMVAVMTVWIVSAELLLDKSGPVKLHDLLAEVGMVYLLAVAGTVSGVLFLELCEKNLVGLLLWFTVWSFGPIVLKAVGLRFDIIYDVAMWLPRNFFDMNLHNVNMHQCITVWDTAEGAARCILAGGAGIAVFLVSGIAMLKRRDL